MAFDEAAWMRKWRAENRDHVKAWKQKRRTERAIADIKSIRRNGNVYIFEMKDGSVFTIADDQH